MSKPIFPILNIATPVCRAIAVMCKTLVDHDRGIHDGVFKGLAGRMRDGVRSSCTIPTMRRPGHTRSKRVRRKAPEWLRIRAATCPAPRPEFMESRAHGVAVLAVAPPRTPGRSTVFVHLTGRHLPAPPQSAMPDPASFQLIGIEHWPTESTMAGRFVVAVIRLPA